MCIFGSPGPSQPMQTYAPPEPRTVRQDNPLPKKKDFDDVAKVKDVGYGGEQTKSNPAAGKKRGASQLKIALNQPSAGSGTGGVNV